MAYTKEFVEQVAEIQWNNRVKLIRAENITGFDPGPYGKPWGVIKRDESLSPWVQAALLNTEEILNIALDLGAKPA